MEKTTNTLQNPFFSPSTTVSVDSNSDISNAENVTVLGKTEVTSFGTNRQVTDNVNPFFSGANLPQNKLELTESSPLPSSHINIGSSKSILDKPTAETDREAKRKNIFLDETDKINITFKTNFDKPTDPSEARNKNIFLDETHKSSSLPSNIGAFQSILGKPTTDEGKIKNIFLDETQKNSSLPSNTGAFQSILGNPTDPSCGKAKSKNIFLDETPKIIPSSDKLFKSNLDKPTDPRLARNKNIFLDETQKNSNLPSNTGAFQSILGKPTTDEGKSKNIFLDETPKINVPSSDIIFKSNLDKHTEAESKNIFLDGTQKIGNTLRNPFFCDTRSTVEEKKIGKSNTMWDFNSEAPSLYPLAHTNTEMSALPLQNSNGFPFFSQAKSFEYNGNFKVHGRTGLVAPGKIDSNKNRPSLDDLKPSLALLAENLKSVNCMDSNSKFEVLDKIDKAIRKGVKSNFHVKDGKRYRALRGTCMDLCPEKERYFRDDKHQVSPFELTMVQDIVSNTSGDYPKIDHCKAIKEYSRSSADQDEPLPHQLRPASVLKNTMDYLVANIMDVKYCRRTDWFDFLWNRTRAIRKDITQQNLGCSSIISIIEKCARFHIFCSYCLCEQELHIFDPKLNLENLTKCLQTLKQMYEDKWIDSKEVSNNEVEFRCYQILLNLNDGDMLREIMHFRQDIRESLPVKFALKVFSAVHENNYVRFFKLLRNDTSFLNACLLQPYFNQIRGTALKTMVRTFSQPNTDVPYSIANLQNILGFDDNEGASEFCTSYGLNVYDSNVYFNRSSFTKPKEFLPTMSAIVAEKLKLPMSQIVNHDQLIYDVEAYHPTNSFSEDGCYVGSYHMLDDAFNESIIEEAKPIVDVIEVEDKYPESQNIPDVAEVEFLDENYHDPGAVTEDLEENSENDDSGDKEDNLKNKIVSCVDDPDYVYDDDIEGDYDEDCIENSYYMDDEHVMFLREDFIAYTDELIDQEVLEYITSIFTQSVVEVRDELVKSEVEMMFIEEARKAVEEVIDEEQQLKFKKEKQKIIEESLEKHRRRMMEEESSQFCNNTIKEFILSQLHSICGEIYKDEVQMLEFNVLTDEIQKQSVNILINVSQEEITQIASDVIMEAYLNRAKLLETNKQIVLKKKLKTLFHKWIKAYKQQQFIKSSLIDFPPLPPLITTKEAVHQLHPDGDISYSLPKPTEKDELRLSIQDLHRRSTDNKNLFKETETETVEEEKLSKPLSSIIEDGMSLLFFKIFHEHCLYCESLLLPVAEPNDIITFYNDTLHAIYVALISNINNQHLPEFNNFIFMLKLPPLPEVDPFDWNSSCLECQDFISKFTDITNSVLLGRIHNILDRYISQSLDRAEIIFPWSEILEACIFNRMSSMYLEKAQLDTNSFKMLVYYDPNFLSKIHVANPLKAHIERKRAEKFVLQKSLEYEDQMKRKQYTREYQMRKSLDSINSELDKLEASGTSRKSLTKGRSSSLENLFLQSAPFLQDIDSEKETFSKYRTSFSPSCVDVVFGNEEEASRTEFSPMEQQTGCKRTFEYSMMECLKGIDDYRMKLKTREDYWREVIDE